MILRSKFLIPLVILAGALLVVVYSVVSSSPNNAVSPVNTQSPTPEPVTAKTYSDEKTGLSFTYPSNFDLEQSPYMAGKEYIVIDPFNSDPETRNMKESAGLLSFTFLEGTTLEKEGASYSNPENQLEGVTAQDVTINGVPAKRISYTAPIGVNGLTALVQWKGIHVKRDTS
jgi:hypothetical protein